MLYAACNVNIAVGGSHSYEGFETKLPAIMEFLNQQVVAT